MESDSNFLFGKSTNSVTNNGRQNGREANYESECHDDSDNQFSKIEAGSEDVSRDSAGKRREDHVESKMDEDVVAVSMMKLYSSHQALEREVQKLKDVGKEDPEGEFQSHQNVLLGDLKTELEEIWKQRVEVEVQYIAISKAMETGHLHQLELIILQQRKLASEQVETMKKVEGAETKAEELKRQAERLKETCQEILDKEDTLIIKSRACRLTSCFSIQLLLFLLVVYLLLLRFSSHNMELLLVPT